VGKRKGAHPRTRWKDDIAAMGRHGKRLAKVVISERGLFSAVKRGSGI